MAGVSETIVREYFEMHSFLVRQFRKGVSPADREDEEIDFLVYNPAVRAGAPERGFVLRSADLPFLERAVVVIKAWHTDVFSPSVLNSNPELFRFLEKRPFQQAVKALGTDRPLLKIMAIPALPHDQQARDQSIALLHSKGMDAVISFPTMLGDLVSQVEANRNYQKSDLLQTIRILKHYDFLKEPQLELFKPARKRSTVRTGDKKESRG